MRSVSFAAPSLHHELHISGPSSLQMPPSSSPPNSSFPGTPLDISGLRQQGFYPCTYGGVDYSNLRRCRAISLSPPSNTPSLLPIGTPSPPTRTPERRKPIMPPGLGILDVEKLAAAPSPLADASREERAQKRRAVHFDSIQLSDAFLPSPPHFNEPVTIKPCLRPGPPHRMVIHNKRSGEDTYEFGDDQGDLIWDLEGHDPLPRLDHDADGAEAFEGPSSMSELTAAFPLPPESTPEFPLSLSSGFRLSGDPPDIPLPPVPAPPHFLQGPHVYSSDAYSSIHPHNRMTVIDPDESMARLEMSMAKLETHNPTYDHGCFFDDDDDEDEEDVDELEPDSDSDVQPEPEGASLFPPLSAIGEDSEEETFSSSSGQIDEEGATSAPQQPHLHPQTQIEAQQQRMSEESEENEVHQARLARALSPATFARVGFSRLDSFASTATTDTTATDATTTAPSVELLPRFDFERAKRIRQHRRRSSSLTDLPKSGSYMQEATSSPPLLDRESIGVQTSEDLLNSSGSHYSRSSASHGSPGYRHTGTQTQRRPRYALDEEHARPSSPLRKARSTPFIHRPVRPPNNGVSASQPPGPPLPPLPPVSTIAGLPLPANFFQHSPKSSTPPSLTHTRSDSSTSASHSQSHSYSHYSASSNGHSPGPTNMQWHHSPRTPPGSSGHHHSGGSSSSGSDGLASFMNLTPEQNPSRMSRLWNRARAGIGMGANGHAQAQTQTQAQGQPHVLKKEKSMRWVRGSLLQARD